MRWTPLALVLATALVVAAPAPADAALRTSQPPVPLPAVDARDGQRAAVASGTRAARRELVRSLGSMGRFGVDPVGGGIRVMARADGFLSARRDGDAAAVALAFVRMHADAFGLAPAALGGLRLTARYRSVDGVTHLTWTPHSRGVPAYDSALTVHVTADGEVVSASGPPLGGLSISTATPALPAAQALGIPAVAVAGAQLVAFDAPGGDRLAWRATVARKDGRLYDEVADAATGELLARRTLTRHAVNATVFDHHPGAGTAHTVDLTGWLTNPAGTALVGPFAHAFADLDGDTVPGGGEEIAPVRGHWDFPFVEVGACLPWPCSWGGTAETLDSEETNRARATTQLFHYVNTFHDWLKEDAPGVGFDDASHNFEVGGTGGDDPVLAGGSYTAGLGPGSVFINNASMATPPDGESPWMSVYLFTHPFAAVHGADDASLVYHEYAHGLTERLVGNGAGGWLESKQSQAMGEGWSDWFAMDFLVANGFVEDTIADGDVRVAEYATGNDVGGIRWQPLDCAVRSPAPACQGSPITAGGGFTFADLGRVGAWSTGLPSFEVHDDGEIWAETLWDLRDALGADAARELIASALRLSPPNPSFLDQRDMILLADVVLNDGANRDAIWQVFAARGMGYGARTSSADATRGVASFSPPALLVLEGTELTDLGDGDGIAEPGDLLRLAVELRNPGTATVTNVTASLASNDGSATIGTASRSVADLGAGQTAHAATFTLRLGDEVACDTPVPLTLSVATGEGPVTIPVPIPLGAGRRPYAATDVPKAIPDDTPDSGVVSSLTVPDPGRVDRLRVAVSLPHTWIGDVRLRLTSPEGTTVDLIEQPGLGQGGSSKDGLAAVTFDDAAVLAIQDVANGSGAVTGTFQPDEPLAAFAGEQRAGTWTLRAIDVAERDVGTVTAWSLDTDQPACVTPPSATTSVASQIEQTRATLNGVVRARGNIHLQGAFEYGRTTAYGSTFRFPVDLSGTALSGGEFIQPIDGLHPGTTYHFRMVALRDGAVVAAGADRTFVTKRATLHKPMRRARLSARNRFAFAFRLSPPGLRGGVRFALPRRGSAKALAFGARTFRAPARGRVELVVRVRGKALARLRARGTTTVLVTIRYGGETFRRTLRIAVPR